jgi:hypothetical protein
VAHGYYQGPAISAAKPGLKTLDVAAGAGEKPRRDAVTTAPFGHSLTGSGNPQPAKTKAITQRASRRHAL